MATPMNNSAEVKRRARVFKRWMFAGSLAVMAVVYGCGTWYHQRQLVLVEQFDNGPVGGPEGGSEGLRWVRRGEMPTPGKNWKPVDPKTRTTAELEAARR